MAYAGARPWWVAQDGSDATGTGGIATYLGGENVDALTMLRMAGLDWTVEARDAYYYTASGVDIGARLLVRTDTERPLGQCRGRYVPFQNIDGFAFLDELVGAGEMRFHTAGSLKGGAIVWALAQVPGELIVERQDGRPDVIAPFALIYIGHDGATAIACRLTTVRVVCWNTLSAAVGGWRGGKARMGSGEFRFRHTASAPVRVAEAREVLGLVDPWLAEFGEIAQTLEGQPLESGNNASANAYGPGTSGEPASMEELADALLLGAPREVDSVPLALGSGDLRDWLGERLDKLGNRESSRGLSLHTNKRDELVYAFHRSPGNAGRTRWDALNAVTRWVDHARGAGREADTRLESAWLGQGAKLKSRALELLTDASA
jgi:phage/plasmid-like protein (TIGR03299 family)